MQRSSRQPVEDLVGAVLTFGAELDPCALGAPTTRLKPPSHSDKLWQTYPRHLTGPVIHHFVVTEPSVEVFLDLGDWLIYPVSDHHSRYIPTNRDRAVTGRQVHICLNPNGRPGKHLLNLDRIWLLYQIPRIESRLSNDPPNQP